MTTDLLFPVLDNLKNQSLLMAVSNRDKLTTDLQWEKIPWNTSLHVQTVADKFRLIDTI